MDEKIPSPENVISFPTKTPVEVAMAHSEEIKRAVNLDCHVDFAHELELLPAESSLESTGAVSTYTFLVRDTEANRLYAVRGLYSNGHMIHLMAADVSASAFPGL